MQNSTGISVLRDLSNKKEKKKGSSSPEVHFFFSDIIVICKITAAGAAFGIIKSSSTFRVWG